MNPCSDKTVKPKTNSPFVTDMLCECRIEINHKIGKNWKSDESFGRLYHPDEWTHERHAAADHPVGNLASGDYPGHMSLKVILTQNLYHSAWKAANLHQMQSKVMESSRIGNPAISTSFPSSSASPPIYANLSQHSCASSHVRYATNTSQLLADQSAQSSLRLSS